MLQGTGSDVGKSVIVAGLCRAARRRGIDVAPFKPQNMSNNAAACAGGEIGRAQALQALAAGVEPSVDHNPVLLKPESDRIAQVIVHGRARSSLDAADFIDGRGSLLPAVLQSFVRLAARHELVLVEGAGSPAETNLRRRDIANMGFARSAGVPVVLLGDIERGGVIANLVGTQAVLAPADAAMIAGFAVNKFRGDPALFESGRADIERRTGWPCFGVIPWLPACARLPAEDAVARSRAAAAADKTVRVVAPMLSRMANFDDADPLRLEASVDFRFIPPGTPLPRDADLVILFGSKSTIAELEFLRAQGWDHDIHAHARAGGRVLGICGGYQMLGRLIEDPAGVDGGPGVADGLGLLDVVTRMQDSKSVRRVGGHCALTNVPVHGYEIHAGVTRGADCERPQLVIEGVAEGARSANGRVEGTYLHGLFASDEYRASYLRRLGADASGLRYEASVQAALDEIADGLEAALDIDRLFATARATGGETGLSQQIAFL
jgi:adenosylcobyric acid synthase